MWFTREVWARIAVPVFIVAVVVAAAVLGVVWFGGDDDPGHAGTDAHHSHIERTETAEGVAEDVMGQIFSYRPAGQEGPWDSMHAASELLTGQMARAAAERPEREPLPPSWLAWAESNDRVVAATKVLSSTAGDGAATDVTVSVRQRVVHPGGDVTPQPDMTATVTVVDTAEGFKVDSYQLEPLTE